MCRTMAGTGGIGLLLTGDVLSDESCFAILGRREIRWGHSCLPWTLEEWWLGMMTMWRRVICALWKIAILVNARNV